MENIKDYIGKVLPLEIASKIWNIVSAMEGYKTLTYVDGGCIIEIC